MTKHILVRLKKKQSLVMLIICMLCSCGGHHYPTSLLTADSLTEVNPDSAVALLRQLSPQMQHKRKTVRMYHRLLTVKAADKADQLQPVPDSILPIVKYYERRGDKHLLPTAYYYAGRTYYELHDAPQALDYFQKAAEVAGEDYGLQSKIYSQMGYLMMIQGLYAEMVKAYHEAYKYSQLSKDTIDMIYSLRDMGTAMESQEKHKEALNYLKSAYSLAKCYRDSFLIMDSELSIANQYRFMYQLDSAKIHALSVLPNIQRLDSSAVYYVIASIYKRANQDDSTLFYSKKAINHSHVIAKDSIYKYLTQVFMNKKEIDRASYYFQQFLFYEDSAKKIKQTEATERVHSLYNYQLHEKESHRLLEENTNMRHSLILVSAGLIFLFMIVLIFLISQKKEKEKRQIRIAEVERMKDEAVRKSELQITQNNRRIVELENQLSSLSTINEELRKSLEREKDRLVSSNTIAKLGMVERDKKMEAIMNAPIYRRLMDVAHSLSKESLSDDDWKELELLVNREYENFTNILSSLVRLSKSEYKMCLLIKIQIPPVDIANILCVDDSTIGSRRNRLQKKYFGKGKAKDWDTFILSISRSSF